MCAVTAARTRTDRCPGITRPWAADDGALLRVRLPGGRVDPAGWAALIEVAERLGDGALHLTSRGNVQVRGIAEPERAASLLAAAGLLPSPAHDLVRNIVCSPLTGLSGGSADLRPALTDLDDALLGDADAAGLPGKFLFALDDGRGDVIAVPHDLGLLADRGDAWTLLVDGRPAATVAPEEAVSSLLAWAHRFLEARGDGPHAPWHIRELPGGAADLGVGAERVPTTDPVLPEPGPVAGTGAVVHGVGDEGTLPVADARTLAKGAERLIVTPWRSVIVVAGEER